VASEQQECCVRGLQLVYSLSGEHITTLSQAKKFCEMYAGARYNFEAEPILLFLRCPCVLV
jgi:hypothetical protein